MTFHWGHKLMLAFLVFGGMMSVLVYRSVTTKFDLVSTEYYKDELLYQQVIDATSRANQLNAPARLVQRDSIILLQLPPEMLSQTVTGKLLFYCTTDARKDRKIPLRADRNGMQLIEPTELPPGNYIMKLFWTSNNIDFYTEQSIQIQ